MGNIIEIPKMVKKQIDDLFVDLKFSEAVGGNMIAFHKDKEVLFVLLENIMGGLDFYILPSRSNLLYFGFGEDSIVKKYFEGKLNEYLESNQAELRPYDGVFYDDVNILSFSEEKHLLNDLITDYFFREKLY
jgi:hypothetical protein